MTKDWTGNYNSIYKTLGATSHSDGDRQEHDYYATDPRAVAILLESESFSENIWEPACGEGHISKVLEASGYNVKSTDLIYRGFGEVVPHDFLNGETKLFDGDIITNPPYKYAKEFVEKSLEVIPPGRKVAMLLKVTFLEGKERKKLFQSHPPRTIYVFSGRIKCAKNGEFEAMGSSAVAYAWYIWEKDYKGDTVVKWVN